MHILLINHYAGSDRYGMEYRPYYLAKEWVRMGHSVTIAAASFSHLRIEAPRIDGEATEEWIDGIRYVWLKTPSYHGNGVRRIFNMLTFLRQLYRHAPRLCEPLRPDVVIASSTYPLDMLPAGRIARRSGARLIFEVHDLWPLALIEVSGMSPRHPYIALIQWAENHAYRVADRVVSLFPKTRTHMEAHGMAPHKFTYIPNGIEVSEWTGEPAPLPAEHREAIDALRAEGRFLIGYAGQHGLHNGLDTLLEAAGRLRGTPATFVLVGKGPEKEALVRRAAELGLENVRFLPPVPKAAIPALLAGMDGLFISFKKMSVHRFGISPNKLMDYLMAARPIIQAIDAGNDMVTESGCGFTVAPEDPGAVADAVNRLVRVPAAEREAMGARGRAYVLQYHDYRVLARQFLQVMESPAGDERPLAGVTPAAG